MDLNYAVNPLINRFKLDAYHSIRKVYSITNSLLDHQKLYVSANYLTAKIQTLQLDEYTKQIQRRYIDEIHQVRELRKLLHLLKVKIHQFVARLEDKL